MHEMCGAASMPSARNSSTVASVPSRVEPPAPKVTEQNAGLSCAELAARRAELLDSLRRARRKELEAEQPLCGSGHRRNSREHSRSQSRLRGSSADSSHEIRL